MTALPIARLSSVVSTITNVLRDRFGLSRVWIGGGSAPALLDHLFGGNALRMRDLDLVMVAERPVDESLARQIGVDEKTVGRWVAQDDRIPHPRHRWAACDALGVDEAVIWPDAIRAAVKTGPDREIAAVYPYRSACPASLWRKLITNAKSDITLAGYTSYFLWIEQPNLGAALRRKAQDLRHREASLGVAPGGRTCTRVGLQQDGHQPRDGQERTSA